MGVDRPTACRGTTAVFMSVLHPHTPVADAGEPFDLCPDSRAMSAGLGEDRRVGERELPPGGEIGGVERCRRG